MKRTPVPANPRFFKQAFPLPLLALGIRKSWLCHGQNVVPESCGRKEGAARASLGYGTFSGWQRGRAASGGSPLCPAPEVGWWGWQSAYGPQSHKQRFCLLCYFGKFSQGEKGPPLDSLRSLVNHRMVFTLLSCSHKLSPRQQVQRGGGDLQRFLFCPVSGARGACLFDWSAWVL